MCVNSNEINIQLLTKAVQTGYEKKTKQNNVNVKSCSVNSFYADMSSEVKPRFGFGSYSHTAVYTQRASSHCTASL